MDKKEACSLFSTKPSETMRDYCCLVPPLGTISSEFWIKTQHLSHRKMNLKMSYAMRLQLCLGLDVLKSMLHSYVMWLSNSFSFHRLRDSATRHAQHVRKDYKTRWLDCEDGAHHLLCKHNSNSPWWIGTCNALELMRFWPQANLHVHYFP